MIVAVVIIVYVLIGFMVAGFIGRPGKPDFATVFWSIVWPITVLVFFIVFVCGVAYHIGVRMWRWIENKAN